MTKLKTKQQGEKISTQHILKNIEFSEEDKNNALVSLNTLIDREYFLSSFDSLSQIYYNKYKNLSGIYYNINVNNIPKEILEILKKLTNIPSYSNIFETKSGLGYSIIYCYEHKKEVQPDLINSWNLLSQYTTQYKQDKFIQKLIKDVKKRTYIKIMYN